MSNYVSFSDQTNLGRKIRRCLQQMEEGHDGLDDVLAVMTQMLNGDGSQAAHFDEVAAALSDNNVTASTAKAKVAWDELNSLAAKFNTDDSVTNVKAAMAQAFARFG